MTSSAPRRADFHDSGAASPLPERPLLTTPPNLQPPGVAGQQRQRLASQPWSGHGGLLLTAVVFFALALGTGSTATALLILGPISTFALPAVAMIAFWWNDWPGSRLSMPWTGLIDTALFIAAAIAATIAGQAIVERPDILAVFETAPAPATFPATLPLAGAAFTAMLQLTAGSPAGCRLQGSAPGIFKDMNDIDHDADRAAAAGGFRADQAQLVPGPVDEDDPGPRRCCGSRASASSNAAAITSAGSLRTDPASHLARAFGPGRSGRVPFRPPGGAITSCGRRFAGSAS